MKKNNSTSIQNQQPKINNNNDKDNNTIVSTYENHRNVVIGPSKVVKTYFMLKVLEKVGNKRPVHMITKSLNQYTNYKTSININPIDQNQGSVVIFDDMLVARNSSQKDEFFTRGRHENLDVQYISQSYFGLPRQSIRKNSDGIIFLKQSLRGVESM